MRFTEEKLNIKRITYNSGGRQLEGLIFKPKKAWKLPGVVFIHGHQSSAWHSSLFGYFLASNGFTAFLPSQMGYAFSKGIPDFCGPKTIKGVIDGVKIFLKQSFVNSERIGIWGISRGANVAASIAVRKPSLFKAAVFQSGAYEMKLNFEATKLVGVKENIIKEAGISKKAFMERSPIYKMDRIFCPVLILHGEKDENISINQAKMLDKKLTELNKPHKKIILPNAGHFLPKEMRNFYVLPFFKKYLKD